MPDTTHDVDLVLTEGSFSQGFDLWTLTRSAPAPVVLYRDATMPTLAATSTTTGTLALSNPADGFSDTAEVSVQSATLGEFPPSGAGAPPSSPDQAVLSVVLDAEYPFDQNDLSGSGHYLGARSPLPGSLLTFIPAGGTAITAIMSNAGDNAGKGNHDDGLFDATYSFVVPADVTAGTLSVGGGSFSGTEFTLYTAERGNTTLDIASPLTLALGFPAVSVDPHQPTPPWVGAPLPPTASGSAHHRGDGRIGGRNRFPIWLAVLVLSRSPPQPWSSMRAVAIRARRRLRPVRGQRKTCVVHEPPNARRIPSVPKDPSVALLLLTQPCRSPTRPMSPTPAMSPRPAPLPIGGQRPGRRSRSSGSPVASSPSIVDELLVYLVSTTAGTYVPARSASASGRRVRPGAEVAEKTLLNYLSKLRAGVGAEHLPDATGP